MYKHARRSKRSESLSTEPSYKYAAPSGAKTIDPACYYRLSGFQFDDRPTRIRAKAKM